MFSDSIAVSRFCSLQQRYGFDTLIETGTHLGVGAMGASRFCKSVFTIEINAEFAARAVVSWIRNGYSVEPSGDRLIASKHQHGTIDSLMGDSKELLGVVLGECVLDGILPCIYLDAHWPDTAVRKELEVIRDSGVTDAVLIFHDFLVPGKESTLRCDEYNGVKLSYDFVRDLLAQINPNYTIEYNSDSSTGIGIMYALPPC